ncbi:histidine phosphatase family protein [Streptomyces sp. NPDC002309]
MTDAVVPPHSLALRAPSDRCARAAETLAVAALPEDALRDLDHGAWHGRTHEDIEAEDPYGYSAWLTDAEAAPHGGESVAGLCRRTAEWLDSLPPEVGRVLTITEAAVVRAALVHGLSAPARAFWHLGDPAAVTLTRRDGCWTAQPGRMAVPRQLRPTDDSPFAPLPGTPATGGFPPLLVRP